MKTKLSWMFGALFFATPFFAVETTPKPTEDSRTLALQQERVRERYRELEKKMQELADLLKEKEPAAAAKLTAALKSSREDLIAANMQAIVQALQESKLPAASEQSAKVVEELQKLMAILAESERSLDSLQKELERLQNQLAAVNELIKQETQEQKQSDEIARTLAQLEKARQAASDIQDLIDRQKEEMAATEKAGGDSASLKPRSAAQKTLANDTKDFADHHADAPAAQGTLTAAQEQMQKASDHLKGGQKPDAAKEQKRALDTLEKAQKQLEDHRAAQEEKLKSAQYDAMKKAQELTRTQAEKLAETMKQTKGENSPASQESVGNSAKNVDGAAGEMKSAEQKLGQKDPANASQNQQAAVDKLKAAADDLQNAINKAQDQQIAQIESVLREMLEKQQGMSGETVGLDKKIAAATRGREEDLKLKELSKGESELAQRSQGLVEQLKKEGSTSVFPAVLTETQGDLQWTATQLDQAAVGTGTQARQKQIEQNLMELIDAFQKERIRRQVAQAGGGGGQCKGSLVPALAELKMLKRMQLRVNERTAALDVARPHDNKSGSKLSAEQETQLRDATQRQAEVEKLGRDLARKLK